MTHTDKAEKYFEQKFQCSQAVLASFADELGLTEKQALKIGASFGGGMFKGEVCGACTGALMVLGLKYGQWQADDTASKQKTSELTVKFLDMFRAENGSYICKELLGCDLSTEQGKKHAVEHNLFTEFCPKMVVSAVRILEQLMND